MHLCTHRVPDRKCESDGAPQTRKHHGVLDAPRNLHSSSKVQDEREGVDVQEAAQEYGNKGANDVEGVKVVLGESEHGDADVGEDEVLSHEVEEIKKALGGPLAFFRQIVVCVMRLGYATE